MNPKVVLNNHHLDLRLLDYGSNWIALYEQFSHMYLLNIRHGSLELALYINHGDFDVIGEGKLIVHKECDNVWREGS